MKNRKFFVGLSLFVVLTLILGACVGGPSRMEQARQHWNATVKIENFAEAQYLDIQTATNEGYMAIKNKYPLVDQCFKNSDEVITNAVSGRYDTNAGETDAPPTGQVQAGTLLNAFVVNEAYPGDISECQRMITSIANDTTAWRMERKNLFKGLWDTKADLDGQYTGDLYRAMAVQLLQVAQEEAQKLGIPVPSYVYPTFNLEAVTKSQDICAYYKTDWNGALKQCTLNGKAAYEYIFRPITAAEVQQSFDQGEDNLNPLATPEKDK